MCVSHLDQSPWGAVATLAQFLWLFPSDPMGVFACLSGQGNAQWPKALLIQPVKYCLFHSDRSLNRVPSEDASAASSGSLAKKDLTEKDDAVLTPVEPPVLVPKRCLPHRLSGYFFWGGAHLSVCHSRSLKASQLCGADAFVEAMSHKMISSLPLISVCGSYDVPPAWCSCSWALLFLA